MSKYAYPNQACRRKRPRLPMAVSPVLAPEEFLLSLQPTTEAGSVNKVKPPIAPKPEWLKKKRVLDKDDEIPPPLPPKPEWLEKKRVLDKDDEIPPPLPPTLRPYKPLPFLGRSDTTSAAILERAPTPDTNIPSTSRTATQSPVSTFSSDDFPKALRRRRPALSIYYGDEQSAALSDSRAQIHKFPSEGLARRPSISSSFRAATSLAPPPPPPPPPPALPRDVVPSVPTAAKPTTSSALTADTSSKTSAFSSTVPPALPLARKPTLRPTTKPPLPLAKIPPLPPATKPTLPLAKIPPLPPATKPPLPSAKIPPLPPATKPPLPSAKIPPLPPATKPTLPPATMPTLPPAKQPTLPEPKAKKPSAGDALQTFGEKQMKRRERSVRQMPPLLEFRTVEPIPFTGTGLSKNPFFGPGSEVYELGKETFADFLPTMDAVLVMFYHPGDKKSIWSKKHMVQAADMTVRANHAYTGVDCTREPALCKDEGITSYPTFKIYSRGNYVGTFREHRTFQADVMKKFIENLPVMKQAPRPEKKCLVSAADHVTQF